MVELKPSGNKLSDELAVMVNQALMNELRFRYVDLIAKTSGKNWLNSESTIVFELRSPTVGELVALTGIIAKIKPTKLDYMHGVGEHCVVYTMTWENQ